MNKRVLLSQSTDPFWNLATEEYLLDKLLGDDAILLIYANEQSVVIGKHQNPWLEVNLSELRRRQISLVRRISGGGTVYHDLGNLNFSFIGNKSQFSRRENLELVARAISSLGIETAVTDTFDLYAGGCKVSGNAFCFRREKVLHHGTLLIDADLDGLRDLLSSPSRGISTHAVRSRPAETINLSQLQNGLEQSTVVDALSIIYCGGKSIQTESINQESFSAPAIDEFVSRNVSWDWTYGRTPDFELTFPGDNGDVKITVRKGAVMEVSGPDRFTELRDVILGIPFRSEDFKKLKLKPDLPEHTTTFLDDLISMW